MPGYCVEHKRYHHVEFGCPDCHSQKRFETIKKLREENEKFRFALSIYADKQNWTDEAISSVLTGNISAGGDEEERVVSLLMGDDIVFSYDGCHGYLIAQEALIPTSK